MLERFKLKHLYDDLADKETSNIVIRAFDADFEEWANMSHPFVAASKQKLQVVLRHHEGSDKVRILALIRGEPSAYKGREYKRGCDRPIIIIFLFLTSTLHQELILYFRF